MTTVTKTSNLLNTSQLAAEFKLDHRKCQSFLDDGGVGAEATSPYGRGHLWLYAPGPARDAIRARMLKPVAAPTPQPAAPSVDPDVLEERIDALLLADQYAAAHAKWELEDLYGSSKSYTAEKLAERHAARAKLERALHAAHVQNPAEIEHVAGDVSKNGVETNMTRAQIDAIVYACRQAGDDSTYAVVNAAFRTQQPAPAAGVTVEQVEDAIGLQSTAWDTIGAEKIVEAVLRLTNGQAPATQQAVSSAVLKAIREANMQLVRTGDNAFMLVPYKVATAQAAESVGRDAALLDWLDQQREAYGFQDIHEGNRWEISGAYANVREAIDAERAARKQGGAT